MNGQMSVFDFMKQCRPFEYRFPRYIGQKVHDQHGELFTVTGIAPYYTYVENAKGQLRVLTPHNMTEATE